MNDIPPEQVTTMGQSVFYKILREHLVEGTLVPGNEIGIRIDQTLTQDATGTMAYLQFEALGMPRVKTELSVSYVDHNTLQTGFENADDHRYLQTMNAELRHLSTPAPATASATRCTWSASAVPGATLLGLRQPHSHGRRPRA